MIDLRVQLLAAAPDVLREQHAAAPQKDELCGAFWGAVVLQAAGFASFAGAPIDQDAVAVYAGTLRSRMPSPADLPPGQPSRTDYRLIPPAFAEDGEAGTTAPGLGRAVEHISDGALRAIPVRGPWSDELVRDVMAAALDEPTACVVANVATAPLWHSRVDAAAVAEYLETGADRGESSEWQVGHFLALLGWVIGRSRRVLAVADTYPSLGHGGLHLQALERMTVALQRPGREAGGLIVFVAASRQAPMQERLCAHGAEVAWWDNGSRDATAYT